jgi:hypothetical protein
MARYSPELIDQTIAVFRSRTGRELSQEKARQAIENISGFFQVLSDWAVNDDKERIVDDPGSAALAGKVGS